MKINITKLVAVALAYTYIARIRIGCNANVITFVQRGTTPIFYTVGGNSLPHLVVQFKFYMNRFCNDFLDLAVDNQLV